MIKKDSLGDRMKQYENIPKTFLMKKTPVLIRIDGKAFHSFTKGFQKPFDMVLMQTMWNTTKYLCENIQGCKLGYTQSDEISLLLTDYETIKTESWFGYNVEKMTSVAASMATMAFNKFFKEEVEKFKEIGFEIYYEPKVNGADSLQGLLDEFTKTFFTYEKRIGTAMFDARVANYPKDEVVNYMIWRQQDATRNSIQMLGQANFSHKQLQKKSCDNIQEMLFQEKNINFNDLPTYQKRGLCVVKTNTLILDSIYGSRIKKQWHLDTNIPIFTQDRYYINKSVYLEDVYYGLE
jgi:tRNA(His) 5'-end guanylyltransferase